MSERPARSLLNSPALTLRALLWQGLALLLVLGIVGWFAGNAVDNLNSRQIAAGFDFLDRPAGFPIGEAMVAYSPADSYRDAIFVGMLNTLKVALFGLVAATVLGTLIGVAGLSRNWLLTTLSRTYVELLRNTPLLLQLFFWYALLQGLPGPRQAVTVGDWLFLSNRGLAMTGLIWTWNDAAVILGALLAGVVLFLLLRQRLTMLPRLALLPVPLLLVLVGGVVTLTPDLPRLQGFNFQGGWRITPEFAALLLGLSLYTAAFIAEIVRAGIQSVPGGQVEAARALGLSPAATLRLVVLPQALRLIIPPTTSQYLNLVKNSSLAVAIGYPDLVSVINTGINQTGQAIEGVALIMAAYLTVSLSLSGAIGLYRRRLPGGGR
jgi:general L-amino acid transport system permease protein